MKTFCPKCGADQSPRWEGRSVEQQEGRDWYCPNCRIYLMMLLGTITKVHVPPPGGGSPPAPKATP